MQSPKVQTPLHDGKDPSLNRVVVFGLRRIRSLLKRGHTCIRRTHVSFPAFFWAIETHTDARPQPHVPSAFHFCFVSPLIACLLPMLLWLDTPGLETRNPAAKTTPQKYTYLPTRRLPIYVHNASHKPTRRHIMVQRFFCRSL